MYPQFRSWFLDDDACAAYLERLRWPDGFVCPGCGQAATPWRQTRGRLTCPACRRQTRVTAGTVLDKTRTPLTTWFEAAWHLTTAKNGMSAVTLQRTLGVGYPAAWAMLQRLRVAMVRSERECLSGTVEVDETFVGGVAHDGTSGRGAARKTLVAIAVEVKDPKGFGRTRMATIDSGAASQLIPFVQDTITPGSVVRTDGWSGYVPLPEHGYTHDRISQRAGGNPAHVTMPAVHRVASLLKRWLLGTHQGSVDPRYLQGYLEEFTFRFNRRTSRSRGLVFRRLLEQAVVTGPVTTADITAKARS